MKKDKEVKVKKEKISFKKRMKKVYKAMYSAMPYIHFENKKQEEISEVKRNLIKERTKLAILSDYYWRNNDRPIIRQNNQV